MDLTKSERPDQRLVVVIVVAFAALVTGINCKTIDSFGGQSNLQPREAIEKTADLSLLINETLAINNRTRAKENPAASSSRDEWTFERVEYDLIEFLQDLNARYKINQQVADNISKEEEANRQLVAKSDQEKQFVSTNVNKTSDVGQQEKITTIQVPDLALISSSQLPVSVATGDDHDISESKWQYGIFDRFTRARSTTPQPHHVQTGSTNEPSSSSGMEIDVRSFNSDECGLRNYIPDSGLDTNAASFFPQPADLLPLSENNNNNDQLESGGAASEASKELNQRRQRPPQLSSVIHRRKSTPSSSSSSSTTTTASTAEELVSDYEKQPPYIDGDSAGFNESDNNKYQSPTGAIDGSEFNLNLRRQWLQQQLGNTLQMLGFNMSNMSPAEFLNQTSGLSVSSRENMMKKSANLNQMEKMGKSLDKLGDLALIRQLDELKARQDELKLEARVIGGTDARLGDSPWSVSLQALVSRPGTGGVEYRHYCGGTIISEYYVLTAAHCLDFMVGRESRLFVVMGDLNWRMSTASMYGKRVGIEKLIIHSGYKSTAFGHDIGLIKTREPIKPVRVNGRYIINSVCLPERNVEHSGEAELVGWGLFSNRNEMADSLQIADVPILPRPLCVDLYRRRTGLIQWLIGIELITDKQICAGTFGRGICQGDSGSALVFNDKTSSRHYTTSEQVLGPDGRASISRVRNNSARDQQTRATQIGVVAFGGIRRCSYQSLPGVYMQTSKYLDWILPRISA